MNEHPARTDGYLVVGGLSHDFDYVRLELLTRLAAHEHLRLHVAEDFENVPAIEACQFLISYTCDVRPTPSTERALEAFVAGGRRWLALHATNAHLEWTTEGVTSTHSASPFFTTLGSAFVAHPPMDTFRVDVDAPGHPLVEGFEAFDVYDELYLVETFGAPEVLLSTRFAGTAPGFVAEDWPDTAPRPIMYINRVGHGEVLYLNLGHARGHYDAPHRTPYYPRIERCAWDSPDFRQLLDRSLHWVAGLPPFAAGDEP